MLVQATDGPLTVRLTAGNNVVLLGMDLAEGQAPGLLGFAVSAPTTTRESDVGCRTRCRSPGHRMGFAVW